MKLGKLKVYMMGKIYSKVHLDPPKIVLMRRYVTATLINLFLVDKVSRIEFCVADCVETETRMRHYFCFCFVVVVWGFFLLDTLCRLHNSTM